MRTAFPAPHPQPEAVPVHSEEFRRDIESIKLRAPIEEVVRERVPGLKKAGALWVACCPFHQEKTPSFKVDPRKGTWHCFGACSAGGDQFSFLMRLDNLEFRDALEILAARTGVELSRRRPISSAEKDADAASYAALAFAERFYARGLTTPEGRAALDYVRGRGLSPATIDVFGLGYAPANGQSLLQAARAEGLALADLEATGLVRTNETGRSYDFFRGRLMIPIRDVNARAVGFGARRLADDEPDSPKYVNTAETRFFHKGRLVYALDRARENVRRGGHIVLMEGYTDVMAAHQVGLSQCVAVLGTATTEDHAAAIRKCGARRITLLFDGDAAGRKAAWKALNGLLHLDARIDVVVLPGGEDPCDVLVRDGAAPLVAQLELAQEWFDFVCAGLQGLRGVELSRAVDSVLELLVRLPRPVQRESLADELSARIGISKAALREQWRASHGRPAARSSASRALEASQAAALPATAATDPRVTRAFEDLVGALLLDASLVPLARAERATCEDGELARIFDALLALYADENATIDESSVLAMLGDDPARHRVVPLAERARSAESARQLLEGQLRFLETRRLERERSAHVAHLREQEQLAACESGDAARAAHDLALEAAQRLHALDSRWRELSSR